MSLTESLRILITANGAQAEREFAKTGAAARAGLGQAETATQQWSRTLTSAGVAMATFGGFALVGLYKAAQAADEENQAIVKLNNSIQNSPTLVGASTDAFLDQAAALQDVTTFADDTTIAAQAMLATFRLTEDQILSLTPLVADVAAKFDVDMVRAATNVGKAMMGQATSLQRWGINIDEARFETDRFGAVLAALEENAGGAAEELGGTFSGQLQILKNNLGDVAEGIGQGVIGAINDLVGPLGDLSDRFSSLDSETQATIGRVATFGATGLVAAGGVSFLAGQVLSAVDRFKSMQTAVTGAWGAMRLMSAGSIAGPLGLIGGAALTAALAFDVFGDSSDEVETDIDALTRALREQEGLTGQMSQQWLVDFFSSGEEGADGLLSALNDAGISIQQLDSILAMSLEEFNAWKQAIQEDTDFQVFDGDDMFTLGSLRQDREQAAGMAADLDEMGAAADGAAGAVSDLSQEISDYLDRTLSIGDAQDQVQSAFNDLFAQLADGPRTFRGNTDAAIENRAALDDVVRSTANAIDVLQQQGRGEEAFQRTKQRSIARIREAQRNHLIEAGAAREAIRAIRNIPPRSPHTLDVNANVDDAMSGLARLEGRIREVAIAYNQADFNRGLAATGGGGGAPAPRSGESGSRESGGRRRAGPQQVIVVGGVG